MDVESLSPMNRDLLRQAMPGGLLINVLCQGGARDDVGYQRERRCFALGERGWLDFMGWEGRPHAGCDCISRWALTDAALSLLAKG